MKKTAYSFTIPALPPSVNTLYKPRVSKYGMPYMGKNKNVGVFEKEAWAAIKRPPEALSGVLQISIGFNFKDVKKLQRCDLDNMLKSLLDTLQTLKVIENDNMIYRIETYKGISAQESVEGKITFLK